MSRPGLADDAMKILVTGNLGYIGPVLTAPLLRAGHEVHGYDSVARLTERATLVATVGAFRIVRR